MSGRGSNNNKGGKPAAGRGGGAGRGSNNQNQTSKPTKPNANSGASPASTAPSQQGSFHNRATTGGIGRGTAIQKHFQVDHKQKQQLDQNYIELQKLRKQQPDLEHKVISVSSALQAKRDVVMLLKRDLEDLEVRKSKVENTNQIDRSMTQARQDLNAANSAITTLEKELAQHQAALDQVKAKINAHQKETETQKKKIKDERNQFYESFNAPPNGDTSVVDVSDSKPSLSDKKEQLVLTKELHECDQLLKILNAKLDIKQPKQPKEKKEKKPQQQQNKKEQNNNNKPKKEAAEKKQQNNKKADANPSTEEPAKTEESTVAPAEETKTQPEETEEPAKTEESAVAPAPVEEAPVAPAAVAEEAVQPEREPENAVGKDEKPTDEVKDTGASVPEGAAKPEGEKPAPEKKKKEPKPPKEINLDEPVAFPYQTILLFETHSTAVPRTLGEVQLAKVEIEKRKVLLHHALSSTLDIGCSLLIPLWKPSPQRHFWQKMHFLGFF